MFSINFEKSRADWGEIKVNEVGASDYKMQHLNRCGDFISAHANSDVVVTLDEKKMINGALNQDANPRTECSFYIDDNLIGALDDYKYETNPIIVEKGEHTLSIRTKNTALAHTLWRINDVPNKKTLAICSCTLSKLDNTARLKDSLSSFIASDCAFINTDNNTLDVTYRLNNEIQNAITKNANVIIVCETNVVIPHSFFKLAEKTTNSCGAILYAQQTTERAYRLNMKPYNKTPKVIAAFALTADDMQKLEKLTVCNSDVIEHIKELVYRFTNEVGTIVSCEDVAPLVKDYTVSASDFQWFKEPVSLVKKPATEKQKEKTPSPEPEVAPEKEPAKETVKRKKTGAGTKTERKTK